MNWSSYPFVFSHITKKVFSLIIGKKIWQQPDILILSLSLKRCYFCWWLTIKLTPPPHTHYSATTTIIFFHPSSSVTPAIRAIYPRPHFPTLFTHSPIRSCTHSRTPSLSEAHTSERQARKGVCDKHERERMWVSPSALNTRVEEELCTVQSRPDGMGTRPQYALLGRIYPMSCGGVRELA